MLLPGVVSALGWTFSSPARSTLIYALSVNTNDFAEFVVLLLSYSRSQ